ncbi:Transmembrane protein 62 [Lunasporangiospora selenospora]|uniref:Transmembrane protein 62 n=1 Tax=Lunasporangiospora selenospora TaxID=979761 RepID=A0A9P6FYT1_9FUNG|nr:Transmembrane protein 62 [Lunasporangiospora selenospora]
MSRRTAHATDASLAGHIPRRSWIKTTLAYFPLLSLVLSSWLYAIHLDHLANKSMVRSRQLSDNKPTTPEFLKDSEHSRASEQDNVVIGDSKDKVFYFIQVTTGTFRRASTANFYSFLSTALPLVEPSFVVVTGDLTDAKDKKLIGSMQYAEEWRTYRHALEESGVLAKRNGTFWHDLRGNHDCFNVPAWDSKENLFAQMSASKTPGFMFDVKADFGKYGFIGIDACPKPGPARPYNFFGLFETTDMDYLSQRLALTKGNNHTFVFSHYPVTTTMFGETSDGKSFAELSKSFSVYMCGHLHKLKWGLGDTLQTYQPTHFLELEVGDMKQNGVYRIMAVDHDMVSFVDVSMSMTTIPPAILPTTYSDAPIREGDEPQPQDPGSNSTEGTKPAKPVLGRRLPTNPIVLVTNPKDSRFIIPKHEPVNRIFTSTHIRFLAWTDSQVMIEEQSEYLRKDVIIEIRIDGNLHDKPASFAGTRHGDRTEDDEFLPLYVAEWDPSLYNDGEDHDLEIKVIDRSGRSGVSQTKFRMDGHRSDIKGGFAEWIMWANIALLIKALFTTGYLIVVIVLLILPKAYSLYLQTSPPPLPQKDSPETSSKPLFRNGYEAWLERKRSHLYRLSSTLSTVPSHRRLWNILVNHTIQAHIVRFVHFSTQTLLFYTTLIFALMLVTVPHFWGNFVPAAGEQGDGYFYLQGIYLPNAGGHLGGGLGVSSVDYAGPDRVKRPLYFVSNAITIVTGGVLSGPVDTSQQHDGPGGTWVPMADTWMSAIWTVFYDLVIFFYYLTLCATPSGYLYSPTNSHRLRPYHRTWYVRCLVFGIWIFRCCSVLMTAELYGPSVIWTGLNTWWLLVVGWLMFMVGWSRSRIERDILLKEDDQDLDNEPGSELLHRMDSGPFDDIELRTQERVSLISPSVVLAGENGSVANGEMDVESPLQGPATKRAVKRGLL